MKLLQPMLHGQILLCGGVLRCILGILDTIAPSRLAFG